MDLTRILEPGMKIYSPLLGDVTVTKVLVYKTYPITVEDEKYGHHDFLPDGRYFPIESECLLFPSKENHDWDKFVMELDKDKVRENIKAADITIKKLESRHYYKPYDKVLVRTDDNMPWRVGLFSHYEESGYCIIGGYVIYRYIIPYDGNESLANKISD